MFAMSAAQQRIKKRYQRMVKVESAEVEAQVADLQAQFQSLVQQAKTCTQCFEQGHNEYESPYTSIETTEICRRKLQTCGQCWSQGAKGPGDVSQNQRANWRLMYQKNAN